MLPNRIGLLLRRGHFFAKIELEDLFKALVAGEPLRNIAKHVSISPAGLLRHKTHVANAISKAQDEQDGQLGETLLDQMRRAQRKAWELLAKMEYELALVAGSDLRLRPSQTSNQNH